MDLLGRKGILKLSDVELINKNQQLQIKPFDLKEREMNEIEKTIYEKMQEQINGQI